LATIEQSVEELEVHDEDGDLSSAFVHAVEDAIEAKDGERILALTALLHEADYADMLELLRSDDREQLIRMLDRDLNYAALPELDETVRDEIIDLLPNETIAEAISELESDDAVYLLENVDEKDKADILARVSLAERTFMERVLEYDEYSAGRLMRTELVAVPPFWNVGQCIDYMRTTDGLPDSFAEIFVIDPGFHLVGTIPVSRILRTARDRPVQEIMDADQTIFHVGDDQEDVAYKFEQYNLVSAAVVDESERLVGMITIDDIVDVIQEEVEEDIHRLGGVGDEELTDSVWRTTQSRFLWLLINLGTAVLASWVISLFGATIEQMVALAILMPIVASMGGNAGTQTMTVAVRSLATRDLSPVNALRVVGRETLVGFFNGAMFAILMGAVAWGWFGDEQLGIVIGAAMIVNMVVAALAGILIPLALDWFDIDPAVSSTVFVTTVTDVVGFFAFLGLAALWLL
jgi:magnesium transporter